MKMGRIIGAAVLVVGILLYFLGSFTLLGWIGIFVAGGGIVLLIKPWDQGTLKKEGRLHGD